VTFAVVAPPKEMILVMFKVFSPSDMMQYHTLLGKAVAVTYSKFRAPGFLFAVAKSKLRVMDLAASQSHPSLQLMTTKLYEWARPMMPSASRTGPPISPLMTANPRR